MNNNNNTIRSISVSLSEDAIELININQKIWGVSEEQTIKEIFKAGGFSGHILYSPSKHKVMLTINCHHLTAKDSDSELFYKYFNDGVAALI